MVDGWGHEMLWWIDIVHKNVGHKNEDRHASELMAKENVDDFF